MIVVTGGTGLTGSHLLLQLVQMKKQVRVFIRPGSEPEKILKVWQYYTPDANELFKKIDWHTVNMFDRASLDEALQGAQQVYHCAAAVSFNPRRKSEIWDSNVNLTRNLVNACLDLQDCRMIHMSSVAAVGKPQEDFPVDETAGWPVKPGLIYAKTKTLGELEVWRGINEGLDAVIVNPSVILGPGTGNRGSSMLFESLKQGLQFYPAGTTGFVDVRDVVDIMIKLGDSNISGERFILNAVNLSYKDFFTRVALQFNRKPPSRFVTPFMASVAWKMEGLLTLFTGKEPRITRFTSKTSQVKQEYSSEKLIKYLDFSFRDIDATIREISKFYA